MGHARLPRAFSDPKIDCDKLAEMAEIFVVPQTTDRRKIYDEIVPQIDALVSGETDTVANLGNIAAALKEAFGFLWAGFYIKNGYQLILSAFQGPVACTRIELDAGVCGACYSKGEIIIVPDVDDFPGHIACSTSSRSEIALPVFDSYGNVSMVLDVDSDKPDDFSDVDSAGLQKIVRIIETRIIEKSNSALAS
jgi:L-methionine (R)-S-oxide reductase